MRHALWFFAFALTAAGGVAIKSLRGFGGQPMIICGIRKSLQVVERMHECFVVNSGSAARCL